MRDGGGRAKGASFENKVGQQLSLWVTFGARADLFARNILSGGRFTNRAKDALESEVGMPGDLMAAHPLAFDFLTLFSVECKFHARLHVGDYLLDNGHDKTFLARTYQATAAQALRVKLLPLVVAKENQRPAFILMPGLVGKLAQGFAFPSDALHYHVLHRQSIWYIPFDEFTRAVNPNRFLAQVKALHC